MSAKPSSFGWTPERRAKQAERIRSWSPWEYSTGPRSPEGKAKASRNAWKGGGRTMLRDLSRTLGLQLDALGRVTHMDVTKVNP
jgi:hypothetical protein